MPTSTNVTNLKINELTEAQYDTAVQGGVIGANELSILTDVSDAIQVSTMPTASAGELDKIYQFVGTTDANYTNGYFYKCVSDGQDPATYSWTRVDVQPGGSSLPDPTGHSGRYLTNNGTTVYWSNYVPLTNQADRNTNLNMSVFVNPNGDNPSSAGNYSVGLGSSDYIRGYYSVGVGVGSQTNSTGCIAIGYSASTNAGVTYGIAIGHGATINNPASYAIQLGKGINATANTFSVGLSANNNYRLLDADGTIPTNRFTTTPSADGTYVPTLTISSGVATRTWGAAASAPVVPATMPTLAVADWSSNTQTVNVTGVTSSNIVFVSPAPASSADYAAAGIVCTAQGSGTLTFTCTTVPSNAITVNVVILG